MLKSSATTMEVSARPASVTRRAGGWTAFPPDGRPSPSLNRPNLDTTRAHRPKEPTS
jgi:hypothetical protein